MTQDSQRRTVVLLAMLAVFICYIDRVNISVAIIPMTEMHGWDLRTQGLILSSFYLGYMLFQLAGGLLSDRFGGKLVLGLGVVFWSIFTLLTPVSAGLGLTTLLLCRVFMGLGEAITFPAIYSLFARWIPIEQRAGALGLVNSGIPLGTVFALLMTPVIVTAYGWEAAFYSFGLVGIGWYLLWNYCIPADPNYRGANCNPPSANTSDIGAGAKSVQFSTLLSLLRHRSIWAIIVAHFCNNWSIYLLLSWLPTYISSQFGVQYSSLGLYAMIPYLSLFIFLNVAGRAADKLIRRGCSTLRVRKTMQSISFGGIAMAFFTLGFVEDVWMAVMTVAIGTGLLSFSMGGFAANHMDVAPRYSGSLMGVTNTIASIPGVVGVYATGVILEHTGSWELVFDIAAVVALIGLVFYLAFASTDEIAE